MNALRSWAPVIILALAVALLNLFPVGLAAVRVAGEWQGIMPAHIEDALYYYARIHEVADGNIYFGNPVYDSYSGTVAPSWSISEWFTAMPYWLTGSWAFTIIFNIWFWSLVSALFIYSTLRVLGVGVTSSVVGALAVSAQLLLLTSRPVAMQVPYAAFFYTIYAAACWVIHPQLRSAVMLALATVLALMSYSFVGLFALIMSVFYFARSLVFKKFSNSFMLMFAGVIVSPLAFAYAAVLYSSNSEVWNSEVLARFGLVHTQVWAPEILLYGRWLVLLAAIFALLYWLKETSHRRATFSLIALGSLLIAFVVPPLIGKDIESAVHIGRLAFPLVAIITVLLFDIALKLQIGMKKYALTAVLLLFVVILGKNVFERNIVRVPGADELVRIQTYAPVLEFLSGQVSGVVHAPGVLEPYILTHTPHSLLFSYQGGFYNVSTAEHHDRYILSRYPYGITYEQAVADATLYDVNIPKSLGYLTPESYEAYKGRSYFQSFVDSYATSSARINERLDEYNVRYIVTTATTSTAYGVPIYQDEQFSVFER